ncbi:MAG: hypothetical protein ACTSPB_11650, partial [Candidatus Thorarchaeota archaeon]
MNYAKIFILFMFLLILPSLSGTAFAITCEEACNQRSIMNIGYSSMSGTYSVGTCGAETFMPRMTGMINMIKLSGRYDDCQPDEVCYCFTFSLSGNQFGQGYDYNYNRYGGYRYYGTASYAGTCTGISVPTGSGRYATMVPWEDPDAMDPEKVPSRNPREIDCDYIAKLETVAQVPKLVKANTPITLYGIVAKFSDKCKGLQYQYRKYVNARCNVDVDKGFFSTEVDVTCNPCPSNWKSLACVGEVHESSFNWGLILGLAGFFIGGPLGAGAWSWSNALHGAMIGMGAGTFFEGVQEGNPMKIIMGGIMGWLGFSGLDLSTAAGGAGSGAAGGETIYGMTEEGVVTGPIGTAESLGYLEPGAGWGALEAARAAAESSLVNIPELVSQLAEIGISIEDILGPTETGTFEPSQGGSTTSWTEVDCSKFTDCVSCTSAPANCGWCQRESGGYCERGDFLCSGRIIWNPSYCPEASEGNLPTSPGEGSGGTEGETEETTDENERPTSQERPTCDEFCKSNGYQGGTCSLGSECSNDLTPFSADQVSDCGSGDNDWCCCYVPMVVSQPLFVPGIGIVEQNKTEPKLMFSEYGDVKKVENQLELQTNEDDTKNSGSAGSSSGSSSSSTSRSTSFKDAMNDVFKKLTGKTKEVMPLLGLLQSGQSTYQQMLSYGYEKAQTCYHICGYDYESKCTYRMTGRGCVLKAEDCSYNCTMTTCGGYSGEVLIKIYDNSTGREVSSYTTMATDGLYNYTFDAPSKAGNYTAEVIIKSGDVVAKYSVPFVVYEIENLVVNVEPRTYSSLPGGETTYLVTVENRNPIPIDFKVNVYGPRLWNITYPSEISIPASSVGNFNVDVASPGAAEGNYRIRIVVSNDEHSLVGSTIARFIVSGHVAPTIEAEPSSQTGIPEQTLKYTLKIKNNDPADFAPTTVVINVTNIPNDWVVDYQRDVRVAAGETANITLEVTSNSTPDMNDNYITVEAIAYGMKSETQINYVVTYCGNHVCEDEIEDMTTCPQDCIQSMLICYDGKCDRTTDWGVEFSATIDSSLGMLTPTFVVCNRDSDLESCFEDYSAGNCGINGNCICGNFPNTHCYIRCVDKRGSYYIAARGWT